MQAKNDRSAWTPQEFKFALREESEQFGDAEPPIGACGRRALHFAGY